MIKACDGINMFYGHLMEMPIPQTLNNIETVNRASYQYLLEEQTLYKNFSEGVSGFGSQARPMDVICKQWKH